MRDEAGSCAAERRSNQPDIAFKWDRADLNGQAYRLVESSRRIDRPVLVIASEFGPVSMWDWEIRDYLRRRGVPTVAPTSIQECEDVCRALATMERLRRSSMLVYQDDLGAGMQPEMFGVTVEHRSFRALAARAASVPDARVTAEWSRIIGSVPVVGLPPSARADAVRMYLALRDEVDEAGEVIAAGVNCLNGSATSTRFVEGLPSHHAILATGDLRRRVELMASVMRLEVQRL